MLNAARDKVRNLFTLENSPYQPLVDGATSEFLLTPDWDKNGRIVDIVRKRPAEAADVVTAIRRRVSSATPKIQFLALALLEACFKNCGSPFRMATAANRPLLEDIIRISSKGGARADDREAQEKALEILLAWRTNFRTVERYRVLVETAAEATKRGAQFVGITCTDTNLMETERVSTGDDMMPEEARFRATSAPTGSRAGYPGQPGAGPLSQGQGTQARPARGGGGGQSQEQQTAAYSPLDPRAQQYAAMIAAAEGQARGNAEAEVQQVIEEAQSCVGLLEELMTANASAPAQMEVDELCQHVVGSNRRVQAQILSMVESGWAASSEANFELLLSLNDTINRSLEKYEALITGRPVPASPVHANPAPQHPQVAAQPNRAATSDLDDLFASPAPPQQQNQNDFDFFSGPAPQQQPPQQPQFQQPPQQPQYQQPPQQQPPVQPQFTPAPQPVVQQAPPQPQPQAQPPAQPVQQPAAQPQRSAPTPPPAAPQAAPVSEDDDFDAFLDSRTGAPTPPARPAAPPAAPPVAPALGAEDADFDDFLAARGTGPADAPAPAAPAAPATRTMTEDDEEDFFQSRI